VNQAATLVEATAVTNPIALGDSLSLDVLVRPITSGFGVPTGTVEAYHGATLIGSAVLDSTGAATFPVSNLPAGVSGIIVKYLGDQNFFISSSALTESVTPDSSATSLTSIVNPSSFGEDVVFDIAVSSLSSAPTGVVALFEGTTTLGIAALNANGEATITVSDLSVGTHSIQATYTGSMDITSSSSNIVDQLVVTTDTTTTLISHPNPSVYGTPVTLSANVDTLNSDLHLITGVVTFNEGSTVLGTANVDNKGQATLIVSNLLVGSHLITATYGGDAHFNSSTSPVLEQTVAKAGSQIRTTPSANPISVGDPVTLAIDVLPTPNGTAVATGTVEAYMGATLLGSGVLDGNGSTSITIPTLPAGNDVISLKYLGDSNFTDSSSTFTETVTPLASSVNLVSSINPSMFGQQVSLTATVNIAQGVPTGQVVFYDGAATLATVSLDSNGEANYSLFNLAVGSHELTAVYEGTANHLSSVSNLVVQQVDPVNSNLTLVSSSNPAVYGNPVTFTAQVSSLIGGDPFTGEVTFRNGPDIIGVVSLENSGEALLTVSNLPTGNNSITASYEGNDNSTPVTSLPVNQTITFANTATVVNTSIPNPSIFGEQVTFFAAVTSPNGMPTGSVTFF